MSGTLFYDLQATALELPSPRMLVCGRAGCHNPTRYVLIQDDTGYGICDVCIEDFDFWRNLTTPGVPVCEVLGDRQPKDLGGSQSEPCAGDS